MNWTMIGALGELAGAMAVVASLLYVGNQVHQNNRIARAEAYRDITLSWAKMLHQWADDPPAAKAFLEGGAGIRLSELPEAVRVPYLLRHAAMIRVQETIFRQVNEGVLSAEALEILPRTATPLVRDAWTVLKGSYTDDFRSYIEQRYRLNETR